MNEERSLVKLEYKKILDELHTLAVCERAKEAALLLRPVHNAAQVKKLLKDTDEAKGMIEKKGAPPFASVSSPDFILQRAEKGATLSCAELLEVNRILRCARSVKAYSDGEENGIKQLFDMLRPNRTLEERISFCIIAEDEINDHASSELAGIRRKMRNAAGKARDILNKMAHGSKFGKFLQDNLITMRGDRFVIPVKAEYRSEVPGIVHDTSGSGATLFIEPMPVVEANNELRTLAAAEKEEIDRILAELSAECSEFSDGIRQSYELIAEIDFIFAKAKLSHRYNACAPEINERGEIYLKKARHPLIKKNVTPIDVRLGSDFNILVITGPNTGGKTVTLKTIGLFVLMAESGLHIPVSDGSHVSVFSHVLADIGDEQSIEQSLSTFSAHMSNIVEIMDTVDDSSLVLLDELGAGTDPVEGAALAISLLERIAAFGAKAAATTHYAELKAFAIKTPGVENASCEFDVATLKPTYKLLVGIPGKSNAFAISKRLGLSDSIIDRASALLSEDSKRFEQVLTDIERKRSEIERHSDIAERSKVEAEQIKQALQARQKDIEVEKEKELKKAKESSKKLISEARGIYSKVIEELEQLQKDKDAADFDKRLHKTKQRLKKALEAGEDRVYEAGQTGKEEKYTLPRPLRVGDTVVLAGMDKEGTVLSLPDEKGELQVRTGVIKAKINIKSVRLVSEKKGAEEQYNKIVGAASKLSGGRIQRELDLRGMQSDEALIEVDRFIDTAVLMDLHEVVIIHGKGTGVLRKAVTEHLKRSGAVKSYRLGRFGEGEEGVTLVEL